ncbi:MAG: hypothetical protein Aurels2KO_29350 [Aureliella sp.]
MTATKPLRQPTGVERQSALAIVLVCLIFSTCTGCHVLGIPSYRSGGGEQFPLESTCGEPAGVCFDDSCSSISDEGAVVDQYRTGLLPPIPMPMWFANWKAKREFEEALPEAPEFPRFHPLPTRPMFSPKPGSPPNYFSNAAQPGAHQLADGMIVGESVDMTAAPPFESQPYQYGRLPGNGPVMEQVQPVPAQPVETIPAPM